MNMHEGGISPADGDIKGADGGVNAGEVVSFTFSNLYKLDPAPIYCGIVSSVPASYVFTLLNWALLLRNLSLVEIPFSR